MISSSTLPSTPRRNCPLSIGPVTLRRPSCKRRQRETCILMSPCCAQGVQKIRISKNNEDREEKKYSGIIFKRIRSLLECGMWYPPKK
ncbi:hypothetical protein WDU94_000471 [Cyamophila willieti]